MYFKPVIRWLWDYPLWPLKMLWRAMIALALSVQKNFPIIRRGEGGRATWWSVPDKTSLARGLFLQAAWLTAWVFIGAFAFSNVSSDWKTWPHVWNTVFFGGPALYKLMRSALILFRMKTWPSIVIEAAEDEDLQAAYDKLGLTGPALSAKVARAVSLCHRRRRIKPMMAKRHGQMRAYFKTDEDAVMMKLSI